MRRSNFITVLFLIGCSGNQRDDSPIEVLIANELRDTSHIVKYEHLPVPPSTDVHVKTDSSVINTKYFEYLNSIREFNDLDSIRRTYYKDFYFNSRKLRERGVIENGDCVGLWKYYNSKGILEKEINFETGEKKIYGGKPDPFDEIFLEMRSKADSFLISMFGDDFFKNHIKWNPGHSYWYSRYGSGGSWFDTARWEPREFRFEYFVQLDRQHRYPLIKFRLDRKGRLIDPEESSGLRLCRKNCNFNIDTNTAIKIAGQNGLTWNSKNNYFYLSWTRSGIVTGEFLGEYELILAEFENAQKVSSTGTVYNYRTVVIDPWSGKLKRKALFKYLKHDYEHCTTGSGLMDGELIDIPRYEPW